MKKLLFTLVCSLFTLCVSAQKTNHALGLYIGGSTADLEYQYHMTPKNFLDFNAGLFNLNDGFYASGIYNWNLNSWSDWTPELGTWKLYAGVGAAVGYTSYDDYDGGFVGAVGNLGFGVTLKTPITIALNYRPMVALVCGHHNGFLEPGLWNMGLSVVYRF